MELRSAICHRDIDPAAKLKIALDERQHMLHCTLTPRFLALLTPLGVRQLQQVQSGAAYVRTPQCMFRARPTAMCRYVR